LASIIGIYIYQNKKMKTKHKYTKIVVDIWVFGTKKRSGANESLHRFFLGQLQ
jgi:hypothetical protein